MVDKANNRKQRKIKRTTNVVEAQEIANNIYNQIAGASKHLDVGARLIPKGIISASAQSFGAGNGKIIEVFNNTADNLFFRSGDSSVSAAVDAANSIAVPANSYKKYAMGADTHLRASSAILDVFATAAWATSTVIALTSAAIGTARNTQTVTLQILAAAANPTDKILADWTGTAAAIVITITPNDGTNNGATSVDLTTAELVEYINTGDVAAKTGQITETDASGFRDDQTATGGDATDLADAGEGDGLVATFSNGVDAAGLFFYEVDDDTQLVARNPAN